MPSLSDVSTPACYHNPDNPREQTAPVSYTQNFSRVGWQRHGYLISSIDVRTVTRRVLPLAAAAVTVAVLLHGSGSQAATVSSKPSLKAMVAEATQLSNEVDALGQQYDGLKIQLAHANSEVKVAKLAAARAEAAMAGSQKAVGQLAAMGYMNGGMDPTLQMLTSGAPGEFLSEASTVQQLNDEAGMRVSTLQKERIAAERAQITATEEITTANQIQAQINGKVKIIDAKLAVLNSSTMSQALAIFNQTGSYPDVVLPEATNVETTALRAALTQRGKPYLWGSAGPDDYDCSGLVVWAYAQEGISMPHYTGSLWDTGEHISRGDLAPGDLVFFGPDIDHVGFYIGNGLMVDAPHSGSDVRVEAVWWGQYVGAVRVA
jgi:cell wall-associated NlpC family hydrolase